MSRLDEIRARFAENDAAATDYEALMPGEWNAVKTARMERARNTLIAHAPDDLRVLLAVVTAAAAWRVAHEAMLAAYQDKERDTTSEAYEAVKRAQVALVEAVKVITS